MVGLLIRRRTVRSWAPDSYERLLSVAALLLLATVLLALVRGHARWGEATSAVWLHLATMITALALTPVLLLRRRGDRRHRWLGRVWVVALLGTAVISFAIRLTRPGQFSLIHLLSVYVLVQAPIIWWSARTHRVALHRGSVRGTVTGALLIAGFFTFPFGRMLGRWLWG